MQRIPPKLGPVFFVTILLSTVSCAVGAENLRMAACPEIMPRSEDYTLMWWADGFRGRSPQGQWLRSIQTGRFGVVLDVERMVITRLGRVDGAPSYAVAARQDNRRLDALEPADLTLTLTVDGTEYRCVGGGPPTQHTGPRLIESGRFFQRTDVTDLVFEEAPGKRLDVDARFEMAVWPDRLAMLFEAQPGRIKPTGGSSFGRVGGGYYFDGTNHIEVAPDANLDARQFTLELWVYLPEGLDPPKHHPWVVCKNGNEWRDGNYGLMLHRGVPVAYLNIGGGPENMHTASAGGPLAYEQWHHLAMTYDGSALHLYVDGRPRSEKVIGKQRTPVPGGLAIGRRHDGSGDGYPLRGALDEIRLFDRAIQAEEVRSRFESPEAELPDGLPLREWTFDPNGPAALTRPSQQWKNASMSIRLRAGDDVYSDRSIVERSEVWTRGVRRTVSIGLAAEGETFEQVPDQRGGPRLAASTIPDGRSLRVEYDETHGWFRVDLDTIVPRGSHNDIMERVKLAVVNPGGREHVCRILAVKTGPGFRVAPGQSLIGISPVLRDADGLPTGIPVQISKNWHRQPDRRLDYEGPWLHAFSMLRLPPRSEIELELTLVYGHWGGVAAASHAQLCLVGWGSNQLWDQSAIGSWGESICYEPDQAQAECAVLDVRPLMVHGMNLDEPTRWRWTNNVGGGDFFRYFNAQGERQHPARMKTAYLRYGPNLTEVTYAGRSRDGKIEQAATVSLYRTNDLVRGIYRLEMRVDEPVDFSRLVFFQIGADSYSYTSERRIAMGSEEGLLRQWDAQFGGGLYKTDPAECTGRVPWISLDDALGRDESQAGAWANRGIVIRHWDATLGGKKASPWVAEHGVKARGVDTSTIDVIPPPDVKRLVPGDYLIATFEHVIVPQYAADYYGPNENLRAALEKHENTWRMIHREAVGNDLDVEVSRGKLRRRWPPEIEADQSGAAEFMVTGGLGYVPVTISGLARHARPALEVRHGDGSWNPVDQSIHGNDFWQTDYDPKAKTRAVTYTVPLDSPDDGRSSVRFRFRLTSP